MKKRKIFDVLRAIGNRCGVGLSEDPDEIDLGHYIDDVMTCIDGDSSRNAILTLDLATIAADLKAENGTQAIREAILALQKKAGDAAPDATLSPISRSTALSTQSYQDSALQIPQAPLYVDREEHAVSIIDPATGDDLSEHSMLPSTPPVVETAMKERFEMNAQVKRLTNIVGRVAGELGIGQWDVEGTELVARATIARNAASLLQMVRKDIKDLETGSAAIQDPLVATRVGGELKALRSVQAAINKKFTLAGILAWTDTVERDNLINFLTTRYQLSRVEYDQGADRGNDEIRQAARTDMTAIGDVLRILQVPIPAPPTT